MQEQRSEISFSKRLIKEQEASGLSWGEVGNLTSNLIGGGVDTTSSSMVSFILATCCFPEKQRRAQEELDRAVGRDRMSTWEDEDALPYITATDFVTTPIHEIDFMESPAGAMSPIEYCTIEPAVPYQGTKSKGSGRVKADSIDPTILSQPSGEMPVRQSGSFLDDG